MPPAWRVLTVESPLFPFSPLASHAFYKSLTSWDFVSTWYLHHSKLSVFFQTPTTSGYSAVSHHPSPPARRGSPMQGILQTFRTFSMFSILPAQIPDFRNRSFSLSWKAHVLYQIFFPDVLFKHPSTSGTCQALPDSSFPGGFSNDPRGGILRAVQLLIWAS